MRKKTKRIVLAAGVLVLTLAISFWWSTPSTAESEMLASSKGQVIRGVTVSGTVRCKQKSAVAAEIIAPVKAMPAKEGQHVSKGDVLVELDGSIVQAQCAMAQARVELAAHRLAELQAGPREQEIAKGSASVKRASVTLAHAQREHATLFEARKRSVATSLEVNRAATNVQQAMADLTWAKAHLDLLRVGTRPEKIASAQAELQLAQADLSRCEALSRKYVLRAPHDGIVTVRYVNVGEIVSPGDVLMRVHNTKALQIRAQVQESQLLAVALGAEAMVLVDAYPDNPMKAIVAQVLPRIDPEQGTVTVLLELTSKPDVLLMDGMTADVAIFAREGE